MTASAQTPSPWTGVVADEARPAGTSTSDGETWTTKHALSGDGRYLVFTTQRALVADDTNEQMDVYLRDRHTGELSRVSLLSTGEQTNNGSWSASISRDGRFILFTSCGTNLAVPAFSNSCEAYVHHRGQGITTRISVGPNGEYQKYGAMTPPEISADGRYVVFGGNFSGYTYNYDTPYVWVRDRDGDGDGTFDEPGESTTTQVSTGSVGDETQLSLAWSAISGDGRWVAYTAVTLDYTGTPIGDRMFVHDRLNGTTVRIDQAPAETTAGFSYYPSFADTGELVYVSSVGNLVPEDTSPTSMDLFVVDLSTLGHTRIARQASDYEWYPVISADGAVIAYQSNYDVIAFDRAAGTWQTINRHPDGAVDLGWVFLGFPSISADGSAIAFMGSADMLVDGNGIGHNGIFVATAVDVSPATMTVPSGTGTYSFDVVVPENIAWTLGYSDESGIESVSQISGTGASSVDVSLLENFSGSSRDHVISLGSKKITIHQDANGAASVSPSSGGVEGGTEVTIHGDGFEDGATVTFDGGYATSVTWISSTEIIAVTPPHTPPQWVNVVVMNPDEETFTFAKAFRYGDVTPPEITSTITGTEGSNGWYVSDVQLTWTVTDPDSAITLESCEDRLFTNSTWYDARCAAESAGGTAESTLQIKVDQYAPWVTIESPEPRTYLLGEEAPVTFSCDDNPSGVVNCTGSQEGMLDTSTAGTFQFTVTADDEAGNSVTETVTYTVGKRTPVITWTEYSEVNYPTVLGEGQLNATADVPGSFSYSPAPGTILDAGYQELSVTFTPTDQTNYETATATAYLMVIPATVTMTWPASADITYGTPLSAAQLNATHDASTGIIEYYPPAGTILDAGTHTLYAQYVPENQNYYDAWAEKTITVIKATPSLTWSNPSSIVYGTALGAEQLSATSGVAGTFNYSPAPGMVLNAGTHTLVATFTSTDPNYNDGSASVSLTVTPAASTISWSNPSGIPYGTALSATQLNASGSVAGTLEYSPAAGTVLDAGTQTLSVTFTPTSSNYSASMATVTIVVGKANPTITWNTPAGITYGEALGSSQLNASATVAGSFAYSPAAGAVLDAGTQTLSVAFTSSDPNYNDGSASVSLAVAPAASTISWSNPSGITYGTALSGTQLNASGSVAGTMVYSPAAGTVLGAGTHTLSVTLTPSSSNYAPSSATTSITVGARPLAVMTNASSKVYGEALPAFTVSTTDFANGDTIASLNGPLTFTTTATNTSAPGSYSVTPSGLSSPNYAITFTAGTLTVSKANTTTTLTTSPSPSQNNQNVTMTATVAAAAPGAGTPTGTVEFRDNGTLLGTASLVNGVATFQKNLKKGSHPLTATYVASTNYNGSVGSRTHQVN